MTTNKLLRSALWYAREYNWFVIPLHTPLFTDGLCTGCSCEEWRRKKVPEYKCHTPGKHPRITDWEDNASNEAYIIAEWWRRWPQANIGVAAGKSRLLDLDLDTYKDGYEGMDILSSEDEQTVTNLSGGGGSHLIFQMPEDKHYTNANSKMPKGIDIRGYGGQFVVPPSLHASGKRYQWETSFGPHELLLRPLPPAVCEILDKCGASAMGVVEFREDVKPPDFVNLRLKSEIVEIINNPPARGGRSEADQKVITSLVAVGATDDEIKAIFTNYPIGVHGKMAEKGANALQYLAHSIGHARAWIHERKVEKAEQNTDAFFYAAAFGR